MSSGGRYRMGLVSCVALIAGACIGSAIFSISGITIYNAGPAAIISWIAAAAIYGAYGVVVSKLAALYPCSGGIYLFPKRAFTGEKGRIAGFFSGWGYVVSSTLALPFSAIYIGEYFNAAFPDIPHGNLLPLLSMSAAAILVFFQTRQSQTIQNILALLLTIALLLFCGVAFFGGHFSAENYTPFFSQGARGNFGFVSSIPLAMVAYGGCVVIAFMASDVKNPSRNVPLSLFIGLGTVTVIYALTICAVTGTVPRSVMENPETMYIPLFAATTEGGLSTFPWMTKVIAAGGVLALFTTTVGLMRVTVRSIQAMTCDGMLPRWSVAAMLVLAMGLCLRPEWTWHLITLGAILNIVSMTVTCAALKASSKRAILPILIAIVLWCCYLPDIISGDSSLWTFTGAIYAIGAAVYFLYSRKTCRRITGKVVHGKGHGHLHGMPTANLEPYPGETLPKYGVWATTVLLDGKEYRGMTNVGLRPSDDDSQQITVETMILDGFSGDIYGAELTLVFRRYIRETRKFADLDQLRAAIDQDIRSASL